mgnify:CR=1 FL=1
MVGYLDCGIPGSSQAPYCGLLQIQCKKPYKTRPGRIKAGFIECSYDSIVDYTIDEKTTDIKLIAKSALPKYEKDEKKQYAVSGLIQAYFFQLMDLVEDYYEYLDVKEIVREI